MTDPIAIDLSHHNTINSNANPSRAKAAGLQAVFHKATQGTGYTDPTYADRKAMALKYDMPFIAYHFLEHGNVTAQIDHFLEVADPVSGERVVIDYEENGCTLSDLREAVQCLLDYDDSLQVTVYSGHLIKDQLGSSRDALLADNTSLWIAQYTSASSPSWPKGTWPTWTLWQYTDKGSLPGIDGGVDFNRFNGSDENAAKWFAPAGAVPEPEPEPDDEVVTVSLDVHVDVPEGVRVALIVNGEQFVT